MVAPKVPVEEETVAEDEAAVADGDLEEALAEAEAEEGEVAEEGAEEAEEEGAAAEAVEEEPELDEEMQAAIAAAEDGEEEAAEEEELDGELGEVSEHLRDAMEGSVRMKRMLEGGDEESSKRRKISKEHEELVKKLGKKWTLESDEVVKHVLRGLEFEEVKNLDVTNYIPDKFHQIKSASDLLARHTCEVRERKGIGGQAVDALQAFKFRWKLDMAAEKKLRTLTHKELRYVFMEYDGSQTMDDLCKAAKTYEEEYYLTASAYPEGPGVSTIGRFGRLELINPLDDAAVFGDANLTFSLKLMAHRNALGHCGRVIATTFEDLPTLKERYPEIEKTIKTLEEGCSEVFHSVDCTRIAIDPKFQGLEGTLGAVYYNFPHSGAVGGFFDGHPLVNWRHENLMRLFFRALRTFVKPGGSVKVSSNLGAVGVRYSYIIGGALENEFVHVETIPFLDWCLHRYGRSYGDRRDVYKRPDATNNQSYNAQNEHRDMVYCFCYAPSGETLGPQKIREPPVLKTLCSTSDGPFKNLTGHAKTNLAKQLHKRFMTEASGVHVG